MKTKTLSAALVIITTCYTVNSFSQANRTLSNLTAPTAVNTNLLPGITDIFNLGSGNYKWGNVYLKNGIYINGALAIQAPASTNFFIGKNSGNIVVTGQNNFAGGNKSLHAVTTGSSNTATGFGALDSTTTGYSNVAAGVNALYYNTAGSNLVAIGDSALYNQGVSSNYANTAVGSKALYANTTGFSNMATGFQALMANTTASYNTGCGSYALTENTTGSGNTAVGLSSQYFNTTGAYNTSVGLYALTSNTTGSDNTALGAYANTNAVGLTNTTVLGYNAKATASNQVVLGNSSITSVIAGTGYVIYSDGRFKKNIKDNVPGLEFIKLLKPVTYNYDIHGLTAKISPANSAKQKDATTGADKTSTASATEEKAMDAKEKKVYTGLIAQDVEKAASSLGYDFSGVYKPQSDKDVYGLSYSEFIMPLIKSVQELSEQNDNLQKQNADLQEQINDIKNAIGLKNQNSNVTLSDASLEQNTPNPFSSNTIINYTLPQKFSSAQIIILDKSGKSLKQVTVSGAGKGIVNIDASTLSSGAYSYSLIVDGKLIGTKQMILTK